ncbi:MAG: DUF4880 domain-containing protein [Opitutus sp.]|nr:DUF4880 domain-containing protein [Opitutus sp.]
MNSPSTRYNSAIDEQAAIWAARLDGDVLAPGERAALDAWLAQNPAHRTALSQYCQFSADLEEQLPVLVAAGAIKMPAPTRFARKLRSFPRVVLIAVAAAAAVIFGVWVVRPSPQVENFATAVAQRAAYTLADGTRVELSAHTSLRFENAGTSRRVWLAGGEALFVVSKDHARPFTVETPAGSVRVTGTTFNVRTDPTSSALDVTVIEGSVQVRPGQLAGAGAGAAAPFSLGAGDQLSARGGRVTVAALSASALDDALAWRNGQIVFVDVPLREAVARFAHYHGRTVGIPASLATEKIGGRFSLDDWNGFLAALEVALPVKVGHDLSGAVFLSPRTGG